MESLESRWLLAATAWFPGESTFDDIVGVNDGYSIQGEREFVSGQVGKAFHFDGNDAINVYRRDSQLNPGAGDFTIEGWVRVQPGDQPNSGVIYMNYGQAPFHGLSIFNQRLRFLARDASNNYAQVYGQTAIDDGQWHHYAAVRSGNQFSVYLDGVLDSPIVDLPVGSVVGSNSYVRIGGTHTTTNHWTASTSVEQFLHGDLDELSFHKQALTPAEISTIVTDGLQGTGKPLPSPSAHYALDGNYTDSAGINDISYVQGDPLFVSGQSGQAVEFDGTDAFAIAKQDQRLNPIAGDLSIEAWIQIDPGAHPAGSAGLIMHNYAGSSLWGLWVVDQKVRFSMRDAGLNSVTVNGLTSLDDGLWHHVAGVRKGNEFSVFVDGYQDASTVPAGVGSVHPTANQYARIGGTYTGTNHLTQPNASEQLFVGKIDDVKVHLRAITDAEFNAISGNGPPTADPGGPYSVNAGHSIALDGSASSDPDNNISTYEWDFDFDGQIFEIDATGIQPTFDTLGVVASETRTIALRVTDAGGLQDTVSTSINISFSPAPLPGSTVAWWPGDGHSNDIIGGHDGTLVGGVTFEPGLVGSALRLDGVDDYVLVADDPSLEFPANTITVEGWVKIDNASDFAPILTKESSTAYDVLTLGAFQGAWAVAGSANASAWGTQITGGSVVAGQWQHVAYVQDGIVARLYVDGVEVGSDTSAAALTDTIGDWMIGGRSDTLTATGLQPEYFGGLIDELTVYRDALSASDIDAIHQAGVAGKDDTNTAPTAVAGGPYSVPAGLKVKLDGSGSSDPQQADATLTYQWDYDYDGSTFDIDAAGIEPTFSADGVVAAQTRTIALRVTDGGGLSDTSQTTVDITFAKVPVPADSLAWWTLDGDAEDVIGGHDGTPQLGASFAPGLVADALILDGVDDVVIVPDDAALEFSTNTITIEAWAKVDDAQAFNPLITKESSTAYDVLTLGSNQGTWGVVGSSNGTSWGTQIVNAAPAVAGQWQHIAFTQSGNVARLYVDGVEVGTDTTATSIPDTTLDWLIGGRYDTSGFAGAQPEYFGGSIDELTIYDRELSASEIETIYNAGAAGKDQSNAPPTADPGGPYTVDEGGSVTLDASASSDPNNNIATYQWDFDYDGVTFDADESGVSPSFSAVGLDGPSTRNIAVRVTDAGGLFDIATTSITIDNVAPTIDSLSTSGSGTNLADSLTHWWSGDASGADLVGASPGTLLNGTQAGVPGYIGGAFQFDGVNDYIDLGNVPEFDFTQSDSYTFEAWVNRFGSTSQGAQAILHVNYSCSPTYQTLVLAPTGEPGFGTRDTALVSAGTFVPTPLTDNTFHHVVGVRDVNTGGNLIHVYVDGVLVSSVADLTTGGLASATSDFIGRRYACSDNDSFYGLIDEVRTYDRALSSEEVSARYVNSDRVAETGENISFTASASDSAGVADLLTFTWDFGDGSPLESGVDLTTVSHSFAAVGNYVVTLTIEDGEGGVAAETIVVSVVPTAPTADSGGPYTVDEGGSLTLDASASTDPNDNIATYEWDLDYDGVTFDPDDSGVTVSFSAVGLDGPSNRNIAVRVTDAGGLFDIASTSITIGNVAPTIALSGAAEVSEGDTYTLNLGAVTDPGDDAVTSYVVNWGDGTSDTYSSPGDVTHTYADGIVAPGANDVTVVAEPFEDTFITDFNANGWGPNTSHPQATDLWSINYFNPGAQGSLATRPMFQFDLSGYAGKMALGDATFRAYLTGPQNASYYQAASRRVDLYRVREAWDDDTVTWNNRPPISFIQSQWVQYQGNNRYIEWTIPQATLQGWLDDPGSNHGVMIVNELPDSFFYDLVFASKEHASGNVPQLEFQVEGATMIRVDLIDEDGTHLDAGSLDVLVENAAPVADAGGPYQVDEGGSITLDASASNDPGNDIVSYDWDFDYDGVNFDIDDIGVSPTFDATSLSGPLTRTIALRVTDTSGLTSTATTTIDVLLLGGPVVIEPGDRGQAISGGAGNSDLVQIVVSLAEATAPSVEADFDAYQAHLDAGNAGVAFTLPTLNVTLVDFESIDRLLEVGSFRGVYTNPVVGTNSSQTLTGTNEADLIVGNGGNDILLGGDGNDILIGASGNDSNDGGLGDDVYLFAGSSNGFDTFVSGDGYDQAIATEAGTVIGVNGYDNQVEAVIGFGETRVTDTNSSRTLNFAGTLLEGIQEVDAGGGNDTLVASNLSAASYRGGSGNDTLTAGDADVTWLFSGSSNGFDTFSNGSGVTIARAESAATVFGVNGYVNGVDTFDAAGFAAVEIRDTNSSRTLDFSSTELLGIAEIDAGGGNDNVTASGLSDASYRGGSGNDTLMASATDVVWLYSGSGNGFDKFTNGSGSTTAIAESDGTVIGVNGFDNGVDSMDAAGYANVVVRDTNSSRTLDFSQTALVGISEIDAGGGNDTVVASDLSDASYRGGFGNDSLTASSKDVVWLYSGTDNGFDSFVNGTGNSKVFAELIETSIGLNGYINGVDVIEGQGDTMLIDSNSSHALDFSQTTLIGVQGLIAGGGNDVITASSQDLMVIEGGAGNDTLIALGGDVTWIYQGTGNGFDILINGGGTSVAEATTAGTVIGLNGYDNGVDEFLGVGDTRIQDTNSSRVLNFSNTVMTGILEIDAAGGNDTLVTSALSNATYRGGAGNDTFVISDSTSLIEVTIADFNALGVDRIDLTAFGFNATTGFADLDLSEETGDTLIDVSDQIRVRLVDLALASLAEDDFLF